MKHFSRIAFAFVFACVSIGASARAVTPVLLPNPNFEDGLVGWYVKKGDGNHVAATPDAASIGKLGLRAGDGKDAPPTVISSASFPVTPGHSYRADVWCKKVGETSEQVVVKIEFYDEAGKTIEPKRARRGWPTGGAKYTGGFEQSTLQAVAPDAAKTIAIVINFKGTAQTYIDDVSLNDMGEVTDEMMNVAGEPPIDLDVLMADIKADPTRGKPPTKIIFKVDDFSATKGRDGVHPRWIKFADFVESKKVKVNVGIVMVSFENDLPQICKWVRDKKASGLFSFWLHGYDHASHLVDGKLATEFAFRDYADVKHRLDRSQELAKQRFGFTFQAFGPPGAGGLPTGVPANTAPAFPPQPISDVTFKCLDEDPDMKVIMYPTPIDKPALDEIAKGKLTILRRVFAVNTESPTFVANFSEFLKGYAHNRGQDYFVLQGHPLQWDDKRFENFTQIVNFLIDQKAEFISPEDLIGAK